MRAHSKEWTVMLYLGAVDKSQAGADTAVLNMLTALKCPMRNVECIYQLALADKTVIGRVTGTPDVEVLAETPAIDLADPDEITRFVDWVTRHYPSRYTALFLKDHGIGLDGIFVSGDHDMPVTALRTAIEHTKSGRVDLYGLDACNMASVELAYELRDVTSFFVATQVTESNIGWNYQNIVSHLELCEETLGPRSLAPFVIGESQSATTGNTIAVELAWTPAVAAGIDALARELNPRAGKFAAWAVKTYGRTCGAVDLKTLVDDMMKPESGWSNVAALAQIQKAFESARVAGRGLTLFLPLGGSRTFGTYGALEFARSNFWARFVGSVNQELLSS